MTVTENDLTQAYGLMARALQLLEDCPECATLIPEVRMNLAYVPPGARRPDEVLAVEGRITVRDGRPAAGRVKPGASDHMARLLLGLSEADAEIRAGINFRWDEELGEWLCGYADQRGWKVTPIDRSTEPLEAARYEHGSMPWKIKELLQVADGEVPTLFWEMGAVGKEDLSVLVAGDPLEVAEEFLKLARARADETAPEPKIGKIDLDTFQRFLLERLGSHDSTVLVPPLTGVDAGVIDLQDGRALVVAEDPIFSIPGQPLEMFGWYTVHIGASDVAVLGVKPRYMTYSLLMPPETPDEDLRTIVDSIHRAASDLDMAIVGGHTGYYPGFAAPTIGGVTVFSVTDRDSFVTPAGARPGDDIILTKGPAIETAGILAALRENELLAHHSARLVEGAKKYAAKMTVVQDALLAMEVGGVTSMHDATEGGVLGGLFEVAAASGVGMEADENLFVYPDEVRIVCETFEIDPVTAIAEGSLLITCDAGSTEQIIAHLEANEIPSSRVGRVTDDPSVRTLRRRDGSVVDLEIPARDPFWPAFFAGIAQAGG